MRNFPIWRKFVADAIRVDILELLCILGGDHRITGMNSLPDVIDGARQLLQVDILARSGALP